jgi:hypothetical protein
MGFEKAALDAPLFLWASGSREWRLRNGPAHPISDEAALEKQP